MEDTIIIKTQYAYMLRLDTGDTPDLTKNHIHKWIETTGCTYYLGGLEKGKKTGKLHFQLIVWFEQKISPSDMTKYRNWWRNKCGTHKNNHAFTSARKVASLAAYSTKEQSDIITNLSEEQLKKVPLWKNKAALKLTQKDEFEHLLKQKMDSLLKDQGTQDFAISYYSFCEILFDIYLGVYDRPCCHKPTYYKYALKYKIITKFRFMEMLYIIPFGNTHNDLVYPEYVESSDSDE